MNVFLISSLEKIRKMAESEEEILYKQKSSYAWGRNIDEMKVNWEMPFLTTAPYLIVVFRQEYNILPTSERKPNYYHKTSVSIASGILLTAIHNAGLVTLTYTPKNCSNALRELLNRPKNERPVLIFPVGFPSKDCKVPEKERKSIDDIMFVM